MKTPLLTRFRWPLLILTWGGAQLAGTAYLYGDSDTAAIGFMIALAAFSVAVMFNTIDEQTPER